MSMNLLIVAATDPEADSFRRISGLKVSSSVYIFGGIQIQLLVTGVGSMATSWAMTKWLSSNPKPDLAINIGIAGSYNAEIKQGEVVVPVTDLFADAGIEEPSGHLTLEEAGLADPDRFPFRGGRIISDNKFVSAASNYLRPVSAITVNSASGSESTIERLRKKFNPDIETMEGATFFYICSGENLPFLALRSISNIVEPRNREKWNISLALDSLSEKLKDFLLMAEL
jgi:futalosine hydrolase